jgi:hypothetical protein
MLTWTVARVDLGFLRIAARALMSEPKAVGRSRSPINPRTEAMWLQMSTL